MIRKATVGDAEIIAQIHVQTWRHAYAGIVPAEYLAGLSEERRTVFWRQQLLENRNIILVGLTAKEVVGWASGGVCRDSDIEDAAEIYAIYVSPSFWGRGVGRKLMGRLEKGLPDSSRTVLWVLRQNQSAIRFYEKLGYRPDGGEREANLGSATLLEIRLRKEKPARPQSRRSRPNGAKI
jgi:ribosomal protein S18 acetylase RimI-like enzyme